MRILFLSDNFPPESNAPASRLYEHARYWIEEGHEVTVVTCAPNFPEGKVYDGYANKWHHVETIDGIRVVRVKTYITANAGFLKRTLDYMSFMGSGVLASLFEERPDVVVATSPQFFAAVGGWALSALRRLPFVFEVRDLWPASIVAVGAMKDSPAIRFLEQLELFLYRRADAIVAVTSSFRDDIMSRGITGDKIEIVRNGADLSWCAPRAKDAQLSAEYDLADKFVVGYLGTHGMAHGLTTVLDAADRLRDRGDIAFFLAGSGAERAALEQQVIDRGLDNVKMIPRQPKERVAALWSLCDLALIPLRDDPVFATVLPSKLFEAMGNGVPVLMSLPAGEATALVESTACGVTIGPEDATAMATVVAELADDPARLEQLKTNALAAAPEFSRKKQASRLATILADVAATTR